MSETLAFKIVKSEKEKHYSIENVQKIDKKLIGEKVKNCDAHCSSKTYPIELKISEYS